MFQVQCLQRVRIRPYLYAHCTDIRKLRSISCVRSRSNPRALQCTSASAAPLGKETTRDLSRVVSVQQLQYVRWVGVSGDGMQEPPNESDASVSTRIIVFGCSSVESGGFTAWWREHCTLREKQKSTEYYRTVWTFAVTLLHVLQALLQSLCFTSCSHFCSHFAVNPTRLSTGVARCVEFCLMRAGWFDRTEPSLATS